MAVLSMLLGAKNLRGVPYISQLHLGKGSSTRITGRGTILSQFQRSLALSHVPARLGPIRAHVAHHDGHDGRRLEARGCKYLTTFAARET